MMSPTPAPADTPTNAPSVPREQPSAPQKSAPRPAGAAALAAELRMAVMRTSRRIRAEGASLELSPGQYSVLVGLQRAPLTSGQLADQEKVQAPSMTRIVNGLAAAGFVRRENNPLDRRQVVVHLTDAGSEALARARSKRTQWLAKRVASLSPAERATLHEAALLLTKMSAS